MTKPVTGLTTFAGSAPPWSLTQLDADIAALQAAINDLGTYANPLTDSSGSANVITVNSAAGLTAAYGFGLLLYIKVANTTTSTAVTINLNSLGNVTALLPGGGAPPVGAFVAGGVYGFIHDGTNFQAVSVAFQSLLSSNNTWTGTNVFNAQVNISTFSNSQLFLNNTLGQFTTLFFQSLGTTLGAVYWDNIAADLNVGSIVGAGSGINLITGAGVTRMNITGAGVISGVGPVAGALVDMTPDGATFAIAASNFASGGTGTGRWSRKGDQVTLYIPLLTGTSNGTGFAFALPAAIQPATITSQFFAVAAGLSSDNGAPITDCALNITATQAQFFHANSATGWTATGTKATGPMTITFLKD